jgi:hypothetical protein
VAARKLYGHPLERTVKLGPECAISTASVPVARLARATPIQLDMAVAHRPNKLYLKLAPLSCPSRIGKLQ